MCVYRSAEYSKAKKVAREKEGQSRIESFLVQVRDVQVYHQCPPSLKIIPDSIVNDLVTAYNLPLSLIENSNFRKFWSMVEERYSPVSRSTITRRLSDLAAEKQACIKSKLEKTDTVSVTVDIWTDGTLRGFLGVTAHGAGQNRPKTLVSSVKL